MQYSSYVKQCSINSYNIKYHINIIAASRPHLINAINVKNKVYKAVIGDVAAHLKPQKIHRLVRFVMYCIITTVPVFYPVTNNTLETVTEIKVTRNSIYNVCNLAERHSPL